MPFVYDFVAFVDRRGVVLGERFDHVTDEQGEEEERGADAVDEEKDAGGCPHFHGDGIHNDGPLG